MLDNNQILKFKRDGYIHLRKFFNDDEVNNFYSRSDWGISHSCFENEPFGYSIFQSIDIVFDKLSSTL